MIFSDTEPSVCPSSPDAFCFASAISFSASSASVRTRSPKSSALSPGKEGLIPAFCAAAPSFSCSVSPLYPSSFPSRMFERCFCLRTLASLSNRPANGAMRANTARVVPAAPSPYFSSSPVSATTPSRTCSKGDVRFFACPDDSMRL